MSKRIPKNAPDGSTRTANESRTTSRQKSTSLGSPASGSKPHWSLPKTVRQFTSQANAVATKLLNGKLDLEVAKTYSALARTVAQTITAEVQRARAARSVPNLDFDDYGDGD
jgi:hypothetical protein